MVRALDRKVLRDLWRLKGQVVSIALVIASGVALLVMSLSTYEALNITSSAYYERYNFGHVFANVKRAPRTLGDRIRILDGVQTTELRISMQAVLEIEDFPEPLLGRVVSTPEGRQPSLNRLALTSGRFVEAGRPNEVVVNRSFANAHGLRPGDALTAVMNGKRRQLEIVGVAASPEFIYVLSPFALIPDKKRYGILWMGQEALEAAFDYDGAFNDLSLTVRRGTDTRKTILELDALLAPYGGTGAIDRKDHLSNWFVQNELAQNRASARVLPTIFFLVAAFLTNTALTRLIATERNEIGLMKAFGYSNREVGLHYAKFVVAIAVLGIVIGWGLGAVLGRMSTDNYTVALNFPMLIYRPSPFAFVMGALVSLSISLLATARAVRKAAALPPVVAMNPPAPPQFRSGGALTRVLIGWLDEPSRIIARQLSRWPGRAIVTSAGFGGAVAMMVLSLYFTDVVDELARVHFYEVQREDLALGFTEPQSSVVLNEVARLPGVLSVEPLRIVSADLVAGYRAHRGAVHGLSRDAALTRVFDVKRGALSVPEHGVIMTRQLADKLDLSVGEEVEVRVLEGRRPVARLPVVGVYESYIGMFAYMDIAVMNRLLLERPMAEYVNVLIDEASTAELLRELKDLPAVSAVALKSVAIRNFHDTVGATLMIFVGFFAAFAFALGFGVTYNAQRIALSERGRELSTLRVLGFSRGEAAYILLGETTLLACLSLPFGCLLGYVLTGVFINAGGFQTELMRVPLLIDASTYGIAITVLLAACAVSCLVTKRWIDRLDLVAVLKTRE